MGIQDFFDDAVNSVTDYITNYPETVLRNLTGPFLDDGQSGSNETQSTSGEPRQDFANNNNQYPTAGEAAAAATTEASMPDLQGSTNNYYAFAEGHVMPERKVTVRTSAMNDATDTQMDETYFRIYPNTTRVGGVPKRYVEFEDAGYVGQNLVDKDGNIARKPYDPEKEAFGIIASFADPVSRRAFLQGLANKRFYGENGKPSASMFDTEDLSAVALLLRSANVAGRTWDVAYYGIMLDRNYESQGSSSYGRSVQYTPAEDVKAVFRDAAQKMLGRRLDDESLTRFADAYRQMERGATGSEAATSVSTAAEQRVMQEYGPERAAVGYTNLARIMDAMIRGGA